MLFQINYKECKLWFYIRKHIYRFSFRLTIRNVNEVDAYRYSMLAQGFRLTIRNVNINQKDLLHYTPTRFRLTIRNVNM